MGGIAAVAGRYLRSLRWLAVLILGWAAGAALAQPLDADQTLQRLRVLPDAEASLQAHALPRRPPAHSVVPFSLQRAEQNRIWWAWLDLDGLDQGEPLLLRPGRFWHQVEVFATDGSVFSRTGTSLTIGERSVPSDFLSLPLPSHDGYPLLLRFDGRFDGYLAPVRFVDGLQSERDFSDWLRRFSLLNGIYGGLILALALFHLFLGFVVRDRVYFWYVLYAGSFGMIWVARAGIGFELLWPNATGWNIHSSFVLIVAALLTGNRFVQVFLELKRNSPPFHYALHGISALALTAATSGALGQWWLASNLLALAALFASLIYLPAGIVALRRGYLPARFYLIACSALVLGVIAYVMTFFGLLPRVFVTLYGAQIGSALEMLLLAFALGDRINLLRREKLDIETRSREQLEQQVQARTAELGAETRRVELAHEAAEAANRQLREANRQLEEISQLDSLTGIANRRRFEEVLDAEWRRMQRLEEPLSVILLDVDHFKDFNDVHGHLAGDACLREIATALAGCTQRSSDLLARFGGEEFAAVLPRTDLASALLLAESMRAAIERLALPAGPPQNANVMTISAGAACITPATATDATDLVKRADVALYEAKRKGRNRVESDVAGSP